MTGADLYCTSDPPALWRFGCEGSAVGVRAPIPGRVSGPYLTRGVGVVDRNLSACLATCSSRHLPSRTTGSCPPTRDPSSNLSSYKSGAKTETHKINNCLRMYRWSIHSNYARFVHKLRGNSVENTVIYFYLLIAAVTKKFSKNVTNFLHLKIARY